MARHCAGCGEGVGQSSWHDCETCKQPVHTAIVCEMVTAVAEGKYVCRGCEGAAVPPTQNLADSPPDSINGDLECAGCGVLCDGLQNCSVCRVVCHAADECREVSPNPEGGYTCGACVARTPQLGAAAAGAAADVLPVAVVDLRAGVQGGDATDGNASHAAPSAMGSRPVEEQIVRPRNLDGAMDSAHSAGATDVNRGAILHTTCPPAVGTRLLSPTAKWGYVFEVLREGDVHDVLIAWDAIGDSPAAWEKRPFTGDEGWATYPNEAPVTAIDHGDIQDVLRDMSGAQLPFAFLCGPFVKSSPWSLFANYIPAVGSYGRGPVADSIGPRSAMRAGDFVTYDCDAIMLLQNQTEHDVPTKGEAHLLGVLVGEDDRGSRGYAILTIEAYSPKLLMFLVPLMTVEKSSNTGARLDTFDDVESAKVAYEMVVGEYIGVTVAAVHSRLQRRRDVAREVGRGRANEGGSDDGEDGEDDGEDGEDDGEDGENDGEDGENDGEDGENDGEDGDGDGEDGDGNASDREGTDAGLGIDEGEEHGQGTPLPAGVSQGKLSKLTTPNLQRILTARKITYEIVSGDAFSKAMAGYHIAKDGGKRATMPVQMDKRSNAHTARQQRAQLAVEGRRAEEAERTREAASAKKKRAEAKRERRRASENTRKEKERETRKRDEKNEKKERDEREKANARKAAEAERAEERERAADERKHEVDRERATELKRAREERAELEKLRADKHAAADSFARVPAGKEKAHDERRYDDRRPRAHEHPSSPRARVPRERSLERGTWREEEFYRREEWYARRERAEADAYFRERFCCDDERAGPRRSSYEASYYRSDTPQFGESSRDSETPPSVVRMQRELAAMRQAQKVRECEKRALRVGELEYDLARRKRNRRSD